jgi:Flp pilus assembly protein TadD
LSIIYLRQGKKNEAVAAAQKGVELSGRTGFFLSNLGYIYTQIGNQNEALKVIKELEAMYSRREATGYHIAAVFVGLGDKDSAFAWLEKDFRDRTSTLMAWMDYPPFDSLQNDARMVDLRRRMGLPQ